MSLNPLTTEILANHPKLTLEVIDTLQPKEIVALLRRVPTSIALKILLPLSHWKCAHILQLLPKTTTVDLLTNTTTDQCLHILRKIPKSLHANLLAPLDVKKRKSLKAMLSYPEDSVGAWMNPAPVSALPENTAGEVLANMYEAKKFVSEKVLSLYVVDINNNFKGMLSISDLLQVNPQNTLQRVMQKKVKLLAPHNSLNVISSLKEWQDFPSLPVIDPDIGLVGELSQTNLRRAQDSSKLHEKEHLGEVSNPLWDHLEAVDAFISGVFKFFPSKKERH